jgi:hypothetical protein
VYSCSEKKKSGQVSTCRIGPFPCQLNSKLISRQAAESKINSSLLEYYCSCSAEHCLITALHGPHGKHNLYCYRGVFTDSLPSNGRHILARVGWRWNVFTESLPINGYTRHNSFVSFGTSMWEFAFLNASRTAAYDSGQNTRSAARICAELLRNWRQRQPSNQSDTDSSVLSQCSKMKTVATWVRMHLI